MLFRVLGFRLGLWDTSRVQIVIRLWRLRGYSGYVKTGITGRFLQGSHD